MVIAINLDDLTQAHIDQAAPHIRQCTYSSPCIIGALMTPEQREVADKHIGLDASGTSTEISTLVNEGHVVLVDPDQLTEVQEIQSAFDAGRVGQLRSEEHTSELQSLMRISYAVFCLKKKK